MASIAMSCSSPGLMPLRKRSVLENALFPLFLLRRKGPEVMAHLASFNNNTSADQTRL
jgi:hypothetical protein